MKKKTLALGIASLAALLAMTACGAKGGSDNLPFNFDADYSYVTEAAVSGKTLKVGAILIGDETEGYSEAHIMGIEKAKEILEAKGASVQITWEKKVRDDDVSLVKSKIETLTSAGNNIVIANSYGHQNAFDPQQFDVSAHPDVDYISMTGDTACVQKKANFHNAFNATYQSRYMSGVVAGLKLKELVADGKVAESNKDAKGNIKLGYVGAYPYAEVVSGFSGFFLGVQSQVPNVVMDVKYTSSWWDHDAENAAAKDLIAGGAILLSQHADSTGTPEACEEAFKKGQTVYNIGYNVSFLDTAPSCSLTSATNNWAVYYTKAFFNKLTGTAIPQDWSAGYEAGSVAITKVNYKCFKASQTDIDNTLVDIANNLRTNKLKVFDCSKFTVKGEHLSEYTITDDWSTVKGTQCIKADGNVKYFAESDVSVRSAPYFDIRMDGITELNVQ